jgi:hypothetical protein
MSSSSFFMETSSSCKPFMRSWSARKEDEDAMERRRSKEWAGSLCVLCVCLQSKSAFKLRTFFLSVEKHAFCILGFHDVNFRKKLASSLFTMYVNI